MAVGFGDGRTVLCDADERGERLLRLRPSNGDRVSALAWSKEGTWLAVGSEGGDVDLFDVSKVTLGERASAGT